jgi:hypothetical protein
MKACFQKIFCKPFFNKKNFEKIPKKKFKS